MILKVIHVAATCTMLLFGTCIAADETEASLTPEDSVIKIGGNVNFTCRSPHGYTSQNYEPIVFKLEHNGVEIVHKDASDKKTEYHTEIQHTIAGLTKPNAGTYTCRIIPSGGKQVSATTHLYVVEADDITNFVKERSPIEMPCLDVGDLGFSPVIRWFVNKELVGRDSNHGWIHAADSPLNFNKAEPNAAFANITCAITSDTAFNNFKQNIEAALQDGAAAEFQKTLSVIHITNWDTGSRQLKISVYGVTPVNISWMIGSDRIYPSFERKGNETTSIYPINSTEAVMLIITGGRNTWTGNITKGPDEKPQVEEDGGIDGGLVAGIVVAVILLVFVLAVICYCIKRNRNQAGDTSRSNIDDPHDANKTADAINLEEKEPLQENGQ